MLQKYKISIEDTGGNDNSYNNIYIGYKETLRNAISVHPYTPLCYVNAQVLTRYVADYSAWPLARCIGISDAPKLKC